MGIDRQTDMPGELQIGPTTLGMVRIYVAGSGVDLPMDFTPEEAREIAEELVDAAQRAEGQAPAATGKAARAKTAPGKSAPRENRRRNGGTGSRPHRDGPRRKPKPGGARNPE